ncbi:MAG TPA: hypothetical protein VNY36_02400 [Bacteroidia bacterium]|jgi:hypothetical protein|nr:hypothetical protein [Bacteroidia bacterium]
MSISVSNLTPTADLAATLPLGTGANTYIYSPGTSGVGAILTAGSSTAALTVDGQTVGLGTIVLVMGESTLLNNGLYVCTTPGGTTNCILTRHSNLNTSVQFNNSLVAVGSSGTANKNTIWVFQNVSSFVVGTSPVAFSSLGVLGMNKNVQPLTPTGGTNAVAWDTSKGLNAYVTLHDNTTNTGINNLSISNLPAAGSNIGVYGTLVVQQPSSNGPSTLVLPSGSTNKVVGGGTGAVLLSTTASAYDIITFYYDGLSSPTFWWTYAPNFN